jgi:hypothetical protein
MQELPMHRDVDVESSAPKRISSSNSGFLAAQQEKQRSKPDVRLQARKTRRPTPAEAEEMGRINEAAWAMHWVDAWPSDKASQKKILMGYINQEMTEWPRFHSDIKEQVKGVAAEVGLQIDDDAFAKPPTTLGEGTYAPIRNAAKKALRPSNKRDNKRQHVKFLHNDASYGGRGIVYGRYGTDHGGQIDVYLPGGQCIGVADPDTGLLYGFSEIRTDRELVR